MPLHHLSVVQEGLDAPLQTGRLGGRCSSKQLGKRQRSLSADAAAIPPFQQPPAVALSAPGPEAALLADLPGVTDGLTPKRLQS